MGELTDTRSVPTDHHLSRPVGTLGLTPCTCLYLDQADEAYQVGKGLTPVAAYLAQDDIIRIALEHGVDMIHPG